LSSFFVAAYSVFTNFSITGGSPANPTGVPAWPRHCYLTFIELLVKTPQREEHVAHHGAIVTHNHWVAADHLPKLSRAAQHLVKVRS
jgi:hypothetical protein